MLPPTRARYGLRRLVPALLLGFLLAAAAPASGSAALRFLQVLEDGTSGITGLQQPIEVAVTPDGRHVVVAATSGRSLVVFERDPSTGLLTFVQRAFDTSLALVAALAVSSDGLQIYAASAQSDQVSVWQRDPSTGLLQLDQTLIDGIGGVDGLDGARDLVLSPDDRHLYVAGLSDSAVAVFERSASGRLTYLEAVVDGVDGVTGLSAPLGLNLSPDGSSLYVASVLDDSVIHFARGADGSLAFGDAVASSGWLDLVTDVAVSPDGHFVVAASQTFLEGFDWLTLLARDPTTGDLKLLAELPNPPSQGGCTPNAADPAAKLGFTSDRTLFATLGIHQAIAAVRIDAAAGRLELAKLTCEGVDGVTGISSPADVRSSPDARHLYVTGFFPNTLAVFSISAIFDDGFETGTVSAWPVVVGAEALPRRSRRPDR